MVVTLGIRGVAYLSYRYTFDQGFICIGDDN